MRRAIVIGGGIGGLATAIRLQHAGWQTTVLEKNSRMGGRCNVLEQDGFTFDTGPTLLLMRDVLDDLFAHTGEPLSACLDLVRVFPNYRVHFADGSGVTLSNDRFQVESELEALESGAGEAYRRYLDDAGYKYRVSRDRFVERNFRHWGEFATLTNLYYLLTTNTLRKLDVHASRYFRDPRLIAALTFQTMYLGLAPSQAPAVYSLLPYTEVEEGIWFPRGGMYRIVEALAARATELGVSLLTGTEVGALTSYGRRVSGVELTDGTSMAADLVVSNADLPYTYDRLVPANRRGPFTNRKLRGLNYGSSAFLMYLGVDRKFPSLHHHDVYLCDDMRGNFDAIFRTGELPEDPSFYLCAASRTDPSLAPPGHEAIYLLAPVPALSAKVDWNRERDAFKERMYSRLEAVGLGDMRKHVVMERTYAPTDFVSDYNAANGSAFGLAHGFRQIGYMRPANKARDFDNLYFVGASTVPGGGIPMVVIGSRLVTDRINQDWGND